jgi:poly-gamma-glutamate capsule biosynthesis protein CapA/YwtB (metallophosphatase superfamily)
MYEADEGNLSIALAGDTIPTRGLSVYREERFLKIREILARADAAFTNLEAPVHRYLDGGHAQRPGGGTYMTTEPRLLEDLKWLGLNMVACGSSHADDYGPDGILQTIEYMEAAGLAHAGSGRNLAEARSPAFLDTPRGRIALVAASGHHSDSARAGEQRRDTPGVPGVNGIRHRTVHQVSAAGLDAVVALSKDLGWHAELARRGALGDPDQDTGGSSYNFLGHTFAVAEESGIKTYPDPADLENNLRQIEYAKASADRVIVSFHCHDQGGPTFKTAARRSGVEDLADFAVTFAHRAIDAGADMFVAHGPQAQLGIEIYQGKPIFYGLGIFIFQLETVRYLPEEAYERYGLGIDATPFDFSNTRYAGDTRGHPADPLQWEQAFFECDFTRQGLAEIRIHPIELGFGRPRYQRGRPMIAGPAVAERVLDRITEISKKYGTVIDRRNDIGVIHP